MALVAPRARALLTVAHYSRACSADYIESSYLYQSTDVKNEGGKVVRVPATFGIF